MENLLHNNNYGYSYYCYYVYLIIIIPYKFFRYFSHATEQWADAGLQGLMNKALL